MDNDTAKGDSLMPYHAVVTVSTIPAMVDSFN